MNKEYSQILVGFLLLSLILIGCAPVTGEDPSATLALPIFSPTSPPSTSAPVISNPTTEPPPATALPPLPTETPLPTALPPNPTETSPPTAPITIPSSTRPAAVILVKEGDGLNIRSGAGVGYLIIETLPPTARGIQRTGRAQAVGGSIWAEVGTSTGMTGWVNTHYLTDDIQASTFCADSQIQSLLSDFQVALENEDGELFASLVSPKHGLDLRYYRYGTLANYTPEEAAWAFKSSYVVDWGNEPGSGFEKKGTFNEVPLPMLIEVFSADHTNHCNDVGSASAFAIEPWPFEYSNINFYNIFYPGTEQYGGLDWRSWLVGVEYIDGKPTLFSMILFQWEP